MDIDTVTKTVEIEGEHFPVVDLGTGPAVLLLHGFPDSRFLWRHQIPALAGAGFRVIAPDLRGFGEEAIEEVRICYNKPGYPTACAADVARRPVSARSSLCNRDARGEPGGKYWEGVVRRVLVMVIVVVLCHVVPNALGEDRAIQRDWARHPAIVEINTAEDIFVVGDVHGDYDRLVKVLAAAGIIAGKPAEPEAVDWRGHKAVVVFTGDLIDKWKHSLKVIALVRSLGDRAGAKGGRVVVLMGNHEAEFLADPTEKKVRDFSSELEDEGLLPAKVAGCEGDLGQFLCGLPFGARVNEWFFSHGGNTDGRKLAQLIAELQEGVDREGFGTPAPYR